MCNQHRLAKTSKTPGRTQQLVYFEVAPTATWSTCPATATPRCRSDLRAHWQEFIDGYFQTREALAGLVVVMDIRHPLREFDLQMLDYARRARAAGALPADQGRQARPRRAGQDAAGGAQRELGEIASVQLFSSETKQGIDEARAIVTRWLQS